MQNASAANQNWPIILSCDGDSTPREGDWLRLWSSPAGGVAHEVWVGVGGIVYESSGPGGWVRRNTFTAVLTGRMIIEIVARTELKDLESKVAFAESKLGTLWNVFYNCQDFASQVATGKARSFQRDGLVALAVGFGALMLWAKLETRHSSRQ
jgi:hypothetical protein